MSDYTEKYAELKNNNSVYRGDCPETAAAFSQLHKAAIRDGALTKKEKELIALGIAVAIRCEGCILSHVKAALVNGATLAEMAETIDVAVLMGGGPSTVYGAKALDIAHSLVE